MAKRQFSDPLSRDVSDDLKRVDTVVTHILQDRDIWNEFVGDPNGVFVKLGLHPPTTPEINVRANRLFYAALTNKKLLQLLTKHYKSFRPRNLKKYSAEFVAGLKEGVVRHDIQYDLDGLRHLVKSPKTLRNVLGLALHDVNEKGILQKRYSRKQINAYIDSVVVALQKGKSARNLPELEVWDRSYGVGRAFGFGVVEVAVAVTAAVAVEVGGVVTTVAVAVTRVDVEVDGPVITALQALESGNHESVRALAIMGRLMDLAGELVMHAQNFERS
jgi:hypothetical protein